MAAIVHPLLALLASLRRQQLAQRVTYIQAENQILRSKLPQRIALNNQERRRLIWAWHQGPDLDRQLFAIEI